MIILGLNFHFHDSTACLVKDGELIVAIEEERLIRQKHTAEFPVRAIKKCLEIAKLSVNDIDHISISADFSRHNFKKLSYLLKIPKSAPIFAKQEFLRPFNRARTFNRWYKSTFKSSKPQVHHVDHHLSHIAGSFYVSPYKEAALLSLDGSGEWSTSWTGVGRDRELTPFSENFFPHSVGSFYEAVTEFCGFRPNYDEGKTMGLAPFGNPEKFYDTVKQIIQLDEDGKISLDLSYFKFQNTGSKRCSEKFYQVFGQPRERSPSAKFEQHHYDTAAAFQRVLEDVAIKIANNLYQKTKTDYLVIAGGVSLNSVMNGRIVRETPFKDVFVMPAAGDNGTAIGSAYYVYNKVLNQPRNYVHSNPFIGTEYSDDEIEVLLKKYKLSYTKSNDICEDTAKLLADGNIIGWFQGKMEIGPRALGARSILANPVYGDMKAKINAEVKYREPYRPFAPSVINERKNEFFDLTVDAPFMLKVCNVLEDKKEVIPAVTHVDGTARVQTVHKETNPRYYSLIEKLGAITGVPIVLNTSFNIMGEPVVENPNDAIKCFFTTGLDTLVIGSFIIKKQN
ncbi:carbamoyltransferase family protein [Aliikangiella coralliicola]|uniref:Carbamoyltransferase n=1 Tax=Aliikangiella coralliicola TaxID=2592383 RepID=A0A545UHH7_9GAMM|nr:carbamoyltransferase C-terminal domain-containing protein [Aliikangiella coralliicola]TQV88908.1 carbamoyltransferase [Aliikangiella coralliicola]